MSRKEMDGMIAEAKRLCTTEPFKDVFRDCGSKASNETNARLQKELAGGPSLQRRGDEIVLIESIAIENGTITIKGQRFITRR